MPVHAMPPSAPRSDRRRIGLAAFDVDGTLLRGPTICECIADGIGMSAQMRAIECLTSTKDIAVARAEMISWYRGYTETPYSGSFSP
jgi:phosphoserine phosphatase